MKQPTDTDKRISDALKRLEALGIKISSYTVYPGKGSIKANVTIELKAKHETRKA